MKKSTKAIIAICCLGTITIGGVVVAGIATKGFQNTRNVLDITKTGTVIETLDKSVAGLATYAKDKIDYLGQSEEGTSVNVAAFQTLGTDCGFKASKISSIWNDVSTLEAANEKEFIGAVLTRTIVDKETQDAVKYFDTVRINYKANTNYYILGGVSNAEDEMQPVSKKSTQHAVASFIDISLEKLEEKKDETVTLNQTIALAAFGLKGDTAELEFDSIQLVNKNSSLAKQYVTYSFAIAE